MNELLIYDLCYEKSDIFLCFRCLLQHGADPNGDFKNLCTPLAVVAQRGYYGGVKVRENVLHPELGKRDEFDSLSSVHPMSCF